MNTRYVYNRTTKDFDIKPIDFKMGTDGKIVWLGGNITSNYTFENPKKGRHLSGIVSKHSEWNGNFTETTYSIGCNYHHYLEGNLRRYRFWKDGEWDMMIELPSTLLRNL
jgi:hypothetical protein